MESELTLCTVELRTCVILPQKDDFCEVSEERQRVRCRSRLHHFSQSSLPVTSRSSYKLVSLLRTHAP